MKMTAAAIKTERISALALRLPEQHSCHQGMATASDNSKTFNQSY
jgi:hypothetical protein